MGTPEKLSLPQAFRTAEILFGRLEESSLATNDPAFQRDVVEGIKQLELCRQYVRQLDLFSTNETIEDISTKDLKYLLVDAYIGEFQLKSIGDERISVLDKAELQFREFISTLEQHEILRDEDKKYLEMQVNASFSAERQRAEKIARFKRERALNESLKLLREQSVRSTSTSTEADTEDDEIGRELTLKMLELRAIRAMEHLGMIKDEKKLLQKVAEHLREHGELKTAAQQPSRMNRDGPLMNEKGQPLRPFVITSRREQLQQQVFGPGYNLPTMTVDEYLQREMERGNVITGGGEVPQAEKEEPEDHDDGANDEATYKARQWDAFKDDNPRGWGNRHGKG
ncbi:TAP42-like protein [Cladochytrium replicatum]|nr:TAP42-like protein [Cladochytrium replicatum]